MKQKICRSLFHPGVLLSLTLAILAVYFVCAGRDPVQTHSRIIGGVALLSAGALAVGCLGRGRGPTASWAQAGISFFLCGAALLLSFSAQYNIRLWGVPSDLNLFLLPRLFFVAAPLASGWLSAKSTGQDGFFRIQRRDLVTVLLCVGVVLLFDQGALWMVHHLEAPGVLVPYAALHSILFALPVWHFVLNREARFLPTICFAGAMAHLCSATKLFMTFDPLHQEIFLQDLKRDTWLWLILSGIAAILYFAYRQAAGKAKNPDSTKEA